MRKALTTALFILALLGGWLLWVRDWYQSVQPAAPDLANHLARRLPPEQSRIVVVDGRDYLLLFGPVPPMLRFPSGVPVYVFDAAGRLVDWTPDEGDDEAFNRRWPGLWAGRGVAPAQVAAWPGATP